MENRDEYSPRTEGSDKPRGADASRQRWPADVTFGSALTTDPVRISPKFWKRLPVIAQAGSQFGAHPCIRNRESNKIERIGMNRLRGFHLPLEDHATPELLALRSLFWFFAGLQVPPMNPWCAWLGARTQRDLIRALLGMSEPDRKTFYERVDALEPTGEWRCVFPGAMAVVRTAFALRARDIPVALPLISIDMIEKIDLLALYKGSYLCMQLKSNQSLLRSEVELLSRPDAPLTDDQRHTLDRIHWFGVAANIPVVPLLVTVGRGSPPWALRRSDGLHRTLGKLLYDIRSAIR